MVRHAHTTFDAHPPLQKHRSGYDGSTKQPVANRSPVKQQTFTDHERSERPVVKSTKRSDETIPSVRSIERDMSRMNIEDPNVKQKRRASVYGHESLHELEGSVEAYQASKGTIPITKTNPIDSLVRQKKTSSDTSSRQSGKSSKSKTSREGSDIKSCRPSSDVKPRTNDNDKVALRFNASQDINFNMKGGIEGRTISVRPSKDGDGGDMELSIGSRGRTTVGSRPPIAGREKSRRRYSYIEGQGGVTEVERPRTSASRAPTRGSRGYEYITDQGVMQLERVRTGGSVAESVREEREPRIVRERIITTERSRRSSRSGFRVEDR